MSDFKKCITNAVNNNDISKDQGDEVSRIYDDYKKQAELEFGPDQADAVAGKNTFDQLKADIIHKKRTKLLQAQAYKRAMKNIDDYPGDPGKAYQAMIADFDYHANYTNLERKYHANRKKYVGYLDELLNKIGRGVTGSVRNKATLNNMVREIFGEATEDVSAREFASAWKNVAERIRLSANQLGMRIQKRKDWGLPQIHNRLDILKAGKDNWINKTIDLLDPEKMIDESSGLPFSREKLSLVLDDVWRTITSGGLNKLKDGQSTFTGKTLGNRKTDHRFLVFKDAESWIKYQDEFGDPNAFNVMTNHIDGMSKDLAELEIFGPNPKTTMSAIENSIRKMASEQDQAGGKADFSSKAELQIQKARKFYDQHTGYNNKKIDGDWNNFFAGTRHLLQASQLGSASISALGDLQNMRLAGRINGIPSAKILGRYVKQLFSGLATREKTQLGARLGLGADTWIENASLAQRYFGDITGPEITRRISDFVMRISALSGMTQAGRHAFGMEFLGHLGSQVNKTLNEIDTPLKDTLRRYGIGEDEWNIIRDTPLKDDYYVDYQAIMNRTDIPEVRAEKISQKVLEAIVTETETAIPSASYRARATLASESSYIIIRELGKSFAMYKNYPVTIMYTHIAKYMNLKGKFNKAQYMADWFIGMTVMGALAIQIKQMSAGKDPQDMNAPSFWVRAIFQGGGLGIFGDFLNSTISRAGGGLETTLAGPVVGLVDDFLKLTVGNIGELAEGKDTNAGKELVRFIARYAPGSSLWYSRLAFERLVLDRLQLQIDPKARKRFRNKQRRIYKEYNQKYWWKPGKTTPSRPPNIGVAIGD